MQFKSNDDETSICSGFPAVWVLASKHTSQDVKCQTSCKRVYLWLTPWPALLLREENRRQWQSLFCAPPHPFNSMGGPSNTGVSVRSLILPLCPLDWAESWWSDVAFQVVEWKTSSWRMGDEVHCWRHSVLCWPQQEKHNLHRPSHWKILPVCLTAFTAF